MEEIKEAINEFNAHSLLVKNQWYLFQNKEKKEASWLIKVDKFYLGGPHKNISRLIHEVIPLFNFKNAWTDDKFDALNKMKRDNYVEEIRFQDFRIFKINKKEKEELIEQALVYRL